MTAGSQHAYGILIEKEANSSVYLFLQREETGNKQKRFNCLLLDKSNRHCMANCSSVQRLLYYSVSSLFFRD